MKNGLNSDALLANFWYKPRSILRKDYVAVSWEIKLGQTFTTKTKQKNNIGITENTSQLRF